MNWWVKGKHKGVDRGQTQYKFKEQYNMVVIVTFYLERSWRKFHDIIERNLFDVEACVNKSVNEVVKNIADLVQFLGRGSWTNIER